MDLKGLAKLGAAVRVAEIQKELAAIRKAFPRLQANDGHDANGAPAAVPKQRRRWKMSAAQRKAVGVRMRKYWAARRNAK